jgi:hypothetical protein
LTNDYLLSGEACRFYLQDLRSPTVYYFGPEGERSTHPKIRKYLLTDQGPYPKRLDSSTETFVIGSLYQMLLGRQY